MISLVDRLVDGLCSVYTFFEPDVSGSSLGTYNVLGQIERYRTLGLLDRREPKDGPQSDVPPWRGWWWALAGTVGEAVHP